MIANECASLGYMKRPLLVLAVLMTVAVVSASCSGSSGSTSTKTTTAGGATTTSAASTGGSGAGSSSVKDACTALPRATITSITGKDLGTGELEKAASSTICRYYVDTGLALSVEIDPGSQIDHAKSSEVAYGLECNEISDIGDKAYFCTGSAHGPGKVGEVIWTDGDHVFYVTYNEGDGTPTKDVPLKLANALQV